MGRNWIHVKDKSKGDPEVVITTDAPVAEGQQVTLIGTVVLNKDFGSGYKYDILIEGGRTGEVKADGVPSMEICSDEPRTAIYPTTFTPINLPMPKVTAAAANPKST
jgi:hypothetical protein